MCWVFSLFFSLLRFALLWEDVFFFHNGRRFGSFLSRYAFPLADLSPHCWRAFSPCAIMRLPDALSFPYPLSVFVVIFLVNGLGKGAYRWRSPISPCDRPPSPSRLPPQPSRQQFLQSLFDEKYTSPPSVPKLLSFLEAPLI